MKRLPIHEQHLDLGSVFAELNGMESVRDYGDWFSEHTTLQQSAAILDFSFRGRFCLVGKDRASFLHGQVTNDIKRLKIGSGCYAALTTAKGKMEADLNIYALEDELLVDVEPGIQQRVTERLERFIVADDVQTVDVTPHYGLLSIQGPKAADALLAAKFTHDIPAEPFAVSKITDAGWGEAYLASQPRLNTLGFDLFAPIEFLGVIFDQLLAAVKHVGGGVSGWHAFEVARIEAGIPRFGADMDETNIPLEAGLEKRAVSFNKGCYIGQEVINRIRSIGHVTKELRGLRLSDDLKSLPTKGDKLFKDGKEVGYITSATQSPALKANIALGYVRREANQIGETLTLQTNQTESIAKIVELPLAHRQLVM